jgi:hypothetical protein
MSYFWPCFIISAPFQFRQNCDQKKRDHAMAGRWCAHSIVSLSMSAPRQKLFVTVCKEFQKLYFEPRCWCSELFKRRSRPPFRALLWPPFCHSFRANVKEPGAAVSWREVLTDPDSCMRNPGHWTLLLAQTILM